MLVFDQQQLCAFAEASFVARMGEVLRALPQQAAPPEAGLDKDIAEQLRRARRHGFTEERDCARWVLCAWCLGPDFDRKIASIAQLIERTDVGVPYKALALELTLRSVFAALAGQSRAVP